MLVFLFVISSSTSNHSRIPKFYGKCCFFEIIKISINLAAPLHHRAVIFYSVKIRIPLLKTVFLATACDVYTNNSLTKFKFNGKNYLQWRLKNPFESLLIFFDAM